MTRTSQSSPSRSKGTVHTSTACILAVFTFCAGLFAGSLYTTYSITAPAPQSEVQPARHQEGGHSPEWIEHVKQARAATEREPQNADSWIHLGNLYFDEKHYADAVQAYETALSIKPGNPDVLTDLGTMYRELGKAEEALTRFKAAIMADNKHRNARFNLGLTLALDLGRTAEAIQAWKELAALYPGLKVGNGITIEQACAPLATDSGSLLEGQNKTTEALLAYTLALMEDPDFVPALERKADLLERMGRDEEAAPLRLRRSQLPGRTADAVPNR